MMTKENNTNSVASVNTITDENKFNSTSSVDAVPDDTQTTSNICVKTWLNQWPQPDQLHGGRWKVDKLNGECKFSDWRKQDKLHS